MVEKSCSAERNGWIKHYISFIKAKLPLKNLGISMYKGDLKSKHILWYYSYYDIIAKVQHQINSCKNTFLSFGDRIILIMSVLNSVPLYTIQVLNMPTNVQAKLERIFNKLIWRRNQRAIHGTSKKKFYKPKEGGLGYLSLADSIKINHIKLRIRFRNNSSSWASYICSKYYYNSHPTKFYIKKEILLFGNLC